MLLVHPSEEGSVIERARRPGFLAGDQRVAQGSHLALTRFELPRAPHNGAVAASSHTSASPVSAGPTTARTCA